MRKAYRVSTLLEQTLEICRWVYNDTLALRKNAWEQEQRSISLYETNKILTQRKKERPDLSQVYSQVLQNVQMRVDLCLQSLLTAGEGRGEPRIPRVQGEGAIRQFHISAIGIQT